MFKINWLTNDSQTTVSGELTEKYKKILTDEIQQAANRSPYGFDFHVPNRIHSQCYKFMREELNLVVVELELGDCAIYKNEFDMKNRESGR